MSDVLATMWGQLGVLWASWLVLAGGIWKLFDMVEQVAAPESRATAAAWLRDLDVRIPVRTLARTFSKAVDVVFGPHPWSMLCFRRSCLVSSGLTISLFLLWMGLRPDELVEVANESFEGSVGVVVFVGVTQALVMNYIPDYFSVVKSRYVIRRLQEADNRRAVLMGALGDTVLSAVVSVLWIVVVGGLIQGMTEGWTPETFVEFFRYLRDGYFGSAISFHAFDENVSPGIYLYSSMLVSLWVWLYAVSALLLDVVPAIGTSWTAFQRFMDIGSKPFLSMGVMAVLVMTAVYVAIAVPLVVIF